MRLILLAALALPLAACDKPDTELPGNGTVSMDVPGFKAELTLPNLDELSDGLDFDGLKLHEGTRVGGFAIKGDEESGGVTAQFADPTAAPAALIGYYTGAAKEAGYTVTARTADTITMRKDDSTVTIAVRPKGAGSTGTLTARDDKGGNSWN